MKNDLGFIILDLQMSNSHNHIMTEIATIIKNNPYKQICIFNNFCERWDNFNIPILPLNQSKYFDGDLFIVDSVSLILTENFPLVKRRYLYLDNVIWKDTYNNYTLWDNLLTKDNLQYIVTNSEIADIIKLCWNKESYIMKNFNAMEIINALQ